MSKVSLRKEDGKSVLNGTLIGGRFRLIERLGGGSFGEVYTGVHVHSGTHVAVKIEAPRKHSRAMLEYRIYSEFNECAVAVGFPQVYFGGRVGGYNVIVMDLLGPNLEQLFSICGRDFGVKTVCMIGIQIIQRIQCMHSMNYIHRDIKPENFVMGVGGHSQTVYVIDMGLSKRYRDSFTMRHIPWEDNKSLTGTARYVSINAHRGIQQSRRDDLESVAYLLFYFLRGSLPWQGLKSQPNDYRYTRICDMKAKTSSETLADGHPKEFARLLDYVRALKFEETPNYSFCLQLLNDVLTSRGETYDYQYSWLAKLDPRWAEKTNDVESMEEEFLDVNASSMARYYHRPSSANASQYQTMTDEEFDRPFGQKGADNSWRLCDLYNIDLSF
ncbi:putative casein kinase 1 isoform 2 [Trypanosoma cruzi]|uniref:non-specific serine/threonine protein kinase n=1 Tax=Trypanosoma cruzi TaxID=5693 RepID=A0A2V2VNF9_TRYCR|nr:casein kinase 1 isoform 2 [Trypanosoma cruzi]PBJ80972.1 casein kinase 1 isoform 2 [Trypanosoma cruzi cruzi]PWU96758.1 putative casein kinase 1 isoform 2 [Trypanosoma cruzi]RNF24149.1 putative casein kinase 1 isoform 2 [Trypanosoma cruzi]